MGFLWCVGAGPFLHLSISPPSLISFISDQLYTIVSLWSVCIFLKFPCLSREAQECRGNAVPNAATSGPQPTPNAASSAAWTWLQTKSSSEGRQAVFGLELSPRGRFPGSLQRSTWVDQ